MAKVLVLGAGGQIARRAVPMLAEKDAELTLMLRDAGKLADPAGHARVVEGDVLDREQLDPAVRGQDIVYANLTSPGQWSHANLGVNEPGTDGDRPGFY